MTSETVTLNASDGHSLQAYLAHPEGTPKAGLLILQEIFGVNEHIRSVADNYAAEGYLAIAPCMYDRVEAGIELDYTEFAKAAETMGKLTVEQCVVDMAAAAEHVRSAGKVGIVGYCWGGAMSDLAACHELVDAAVSYYGRKTVEWLDLTPHCPVLYHYGEVDQLIPMDTIEQIAHKRAGHEVRVWGGADHGFSCDVRDSYHKNAATQARALTLGHFAEHLS